MTCEKFDERLQQLLDQRLEPAEDRELQRHAEQCGDCRLLLEAQGRLFSAFGFGTEGSAGLPENFAEKLVATIVAERPTQRSWGRSAWAVALMAVASLLLLAFLPGLRGPSTQRLSTPPSGGGMVKTVVPTVPVVVETKEVPVVTSTAPEALAVASALSPGQGAGDWIDNLRESISEVSLENLEPMDQIADGFRPVATSLQSAVGVLRRTLPGGGEQRPKPMPDASGMWNAELIAHV